jgi:hypothetical protein
VNEQRLRRGLHELELSGERDAQERGWRVVRAAFSERPAPPRSSRRGLRPALAAAALAAVLATALSPAGAAVGDWVGDVVDRPPDEPKRTRLALPASGQLLVSTTQGPWIVRRDGSRRLLGRYDEASWSPRGRFVVAARDRRLAALGPDGRTRWALTARRPVSGVRWAPSGFRIAYLSGLRSGYERPPAAGTAGQPQVLRVVAGDGTGDRMLARAVAEARPAWRPGKLHVLAFADLQGRVRVVAADTGHLLWRSARGAHPHQLDWSADGQRLTALGARTLRIFDGRGRLLRTLRSGRHDLPAPLPGDSRVLSFARRGHAFALIRGTESGENEVVMRAAERSGGARRLFVGLGGFGDLAWSPDGRWLLITWPGAGQWVFVRPQPSRRLQTISDVAREFDPDAMPAGGDVGEGGEWCCPP